ncbi:MAG: DinB family protein [Vicinamibacterales bacterium]
MPPELQRLLDEIAAAEADARALAASLTDAQANWQPGGGTGWSVAQCLDHLALSNSAYTSHFLPVAERARGAGPTPFTGLAPTAIGRWFVGTLEPPPRRKIKTFEKLVPPSSMPLADALAAYVGSHDPYRRLVALAAELDPNRVVAANPFLGWVRMRLSTALLVVPAHDRRHLWQARRVVEAPGFPRS